MNEDSSIISVTYWENKQGRNDPMNPLDASHYLFDPKSIYGNFENRILNLNYHIENDQIIFFFMNSRIILAFLVFAAVFAA